MPRLPRILLLLLLGLAAAATAVRAGGPAVLEYERSAEARILRFERTALKLEGAAPLVLELFGDGRVVVERPAPLRPAGRFEARLPDADLQRLLERVAVPAVVDLDPAAQAVRLGRLGASRAEAAREGRAVLRSSSGDQLVRLELALERWRPAGETGEPRRGLRTAWSLRRPGELRLEHPGDPELEALAAALAAIDELLARPSWRGAP